MERLPLRWATNHLAFFAIDAYSCRRFNDRIYITSVTHWAGFFVISTGFKLLGAMADPENVVELLRMARVGVIRPFMFVLDVGAYGLRPRPLFSRRMRAPPVDGTTGGLRKGRVGEGERKSQHRRNGRNKQQTQSPLFHSLPHTGLPSSAYVMMKRGSRHRDDSSNAVKGT